MWRWGYWPRPFPPPSWGDGFWVWVERAYVVASVADVCLVIAMDGLVPPGWDEPIREIFWVSLEIIKRWGKPGLGALALAQMVIVLFLAQRSPFWRGVMALRLVESVLGAWSWLRLIYW